MTATIMTWQVVATPSGWFEVEVMADGEPTFALKKSRTPGGAIDHLYTWAAKQGITDINIAGVLMRAS